MARNTFFWLKTYCIEAGSGEEGFGGRGTDQGEDFGGLDPGSGASGAGGQGIGGAGIGTTGDTDSDAELGRTFVAPESIVRQDLAEFGAFSAQRDNFVENLQFALGLGPDVSEAVKRGAAIADPGSFAAGVKTGTGFELAGAAASLGGLPAVAATSILDRVVSAFSGPAFSAGRASVSNPFGQLAPAGGLAAQLAGGSIGLAKAIELGLNVAGIATQVPESLQGGQLPTANNTSTAQAGTGQQGIIPQNLSQAQGTAQGAAISSRTDEDFQQARRTLTSRESLGRSDLTIGRV